VCEAAISASEMSDSRYHSWMYVDAEMLPVSVQPFNHC
jgi:hypothetical protein